LASQFEFSSLVKKWHSTHNKLAPIISTKHFLGDSASLRQLLNKITQKLPTEAEMWHQFYIDLTSRDGATINRSGVQLSAGMLNA